MHNETGTQPKYPSTEEWINELYGTIYKGIQEWTTDTCINTEEPQKYYTKSKISQTQKTTYCVSPFIWHFCRDKPRRTANRSVVLGRWVWGEGLDDKEAWDNRGMTIVPYLACCGSHVTVNTCQNTQKCTPKRVNFTACKLGLNFKNGGGGNQWTIPAFTFLTNIY